MTGKRTKKMNGSYPKLLVSLVRYELDWFFNLFFVLKSIYLITKKIVYLIFLHYFVLTYINNYMLTYPFVLKKKKSSSKRCALKKKTLGVWCTPIIALLVGAMILCILVKNFTNSFGIKVSTFHLYHLKIKERKSSSHLTSHTPQGRERERERGREKRSDQRRKRDPSMRPNLV